jgi:hypothetical protein
MYFEEINHYLITQPIMAFDYYTIENRTYSHVHTRWLLLGVLKAVWMPAGLDAIRLPELKRPGFGSNLVLDNSLLHAARGAQAVAHASDGVTNYSNYRILFSTFDIVIHSCLNNYFYINGESIRQNKMKHEHNYTEDRKIYFVLQYLTNQMPFGIQFCTLGCR